MAEIFFGLGSNMGDRAENLKKAAELLKTYNIRALKKSSVYETAPVGYFRQRDFYNMCLLAEAEAKPADLLGVVKKIEAKMGRKKGVKHGPRIIDIDILFYNNIIIKEKELLIPHPEIEKRKFVLIPLNEIAGNFVHPELRLTVKELLEKCGDTGKANIIGAV